MISVIREVMRAIREGGLLNNGEIVDQAGIQESTLESILFMLSTKGYLKTAESVTDLPSGYARYPVRVSCMTKT